ncbi:hypothetical protein O5D80_008320 [Batrachochytrium dendrobatidis]|nr:hypothetical protein O5D80_008320 [Batrachochytrium dendrobatidis]
MYVLEAGSTTAAEKHHIVRLIGSIQKVDSVIKLIGQLLRSSCSTTPCYMTLVDSVCVLLRDDEHNSKPTDILSIKPSQVVLISMIGCDKSMINENDGTANFCMFSADPNEQKQAIQMLLSTIKLAMQPCNEPYQSITIHGCPLIYKPFVDTLVSYKWKSDVYHMYVTKSPINKYNVAIGDCWVDDTTGETFVIDHIKESDIPAIMLERTVDYGVDYVRFATLEYPLSQLNCVIRVFPKGVDPVSNPSLGVPVSWAASHHDFQIGMLATIDSYRRRSLAAKCVEVVSQLQLHFLKSNFETLLGDSILSFGFVKEGNDASAAVMEQCGYSRYEQDQFQWLGVNAMDIE